MNIVSMRPTFSRAPEASGGFRYVQERMWAERGEVRGLLEEGAKVLVCGRRAVAVAVEECLVRIWADGDIKGEMGGREWMEGVRGSGVVWDVFG